jgi:hypothetical protein
MLRGTAVLLGFAAGAFAQAPPEGFIFAGDDLSGFDIRLQSVLVYRIRGVVRDESGNPVAALPIRLDRDGPNASKAQVFRAAGGFRVEAPGGDRVIRAVRQGKDGSFEFPAVRSGDWLLTAESARLNPMARCVFDTSARDNIALWRRPA